MAVKGVFTSDAHIVGDKKGDFASALLQIDPMGTAPMFALTSGMESADATDTIVNWFEEVLNPGRVGITNNAGTGTSLTVDSGDYVTSGQVYLVETTGEYIFVASVAGSTATVERGFASTTPTAVNGSVTTVFMQRIGSAFEEGSSRPEAIANLGYPRFNYMQIFRNSWDLSGTSRQVEYYTTSDRKAKNKKDCANFHAEDIERSLIFGRKTIGTRNSRPFRTMDGVQTQISTNVVSQPGGGMTYASIDNFLQQVFERNVRGKPNERIAFCGNSVVTTINALARATAQMNIQPGVTEFGMKVMKWMTPFGDISLMTHPMFVQNPIWTKQLLVLHPGAVRLRYLRRTEEDNNDRSGAREGRDADYGVLTTELTVEYRAERTGGIFTGMDAVSATP
jgi:hypothetical protein